jgi:hypothetical protein
MAEGEKTAEAKRTSEAKRKPEGKRTPEAKRPSQAKRKPDDKTMSEGKRAYEAKRAAKAGMSLDKYLAAKERDRLAEEKAKAKLLEAAKPTKPPGLFKRLLERAHRPLKS